MREWLIKEKVMTVMFKFEEVTNQNEFEAKARLIQERQERAWTALLDMSQEEGPGVFLEFMDWTDAGVQARADLKMRAEKLIEQAYEDRLKKIDQMAFDEGPGVYLQQRVDGEVSYGFGGRNPDHQKQVMRRAADKAKAAALEAVRALA